MKRLGMSVLFLATMATGCTSVDKNVDQKEAASPPVESRTDLNKEARLFIEKAKGISEDQRQKLLTLRHATRSSIGQLQEESLKLRSLLIQEILTSQYNSSEVDVIKSRLKKVEERRLTVMFDAVDKANKIIGRTRIENDKEMYFELFDQPLINQRL